MFVFDFPASKVPLAIILLLFRSFHYRFHASVVTFHWRREQYRHDKDTWPERVVRSLGPKRNRKEERHDLTDVNSSFTVFWPLLHSNKDKPHHSVNSLRSRRIKGTLHTAGAREIWIDQSGFSRWEKIQCPHLSVKSKLQHPPWAYPGHLTPFLAREGGNLITTHRGWGIC